MARRQATFIQRAYVGIDFSLSSTGISINDGNRVLTNHLNPVTKKSKQQNTNRLKEITDKVLYTFSGLWNRFNRKDIYIFIEDYAFGAVGKTFDIAECVGILKYRLFFEYKIPFENVFLVSVPHLKMFCCGKGNAQKDMIIKEVYKRWRYDTNDNNEADAFVLMQIAMSFFKTNPKLPAFQLEALKRIKEYNQDAKPKNKKQKAKKVSV